MKRTYILTLLLFIVAMVHLSSCDQSIDNLYTEKSRIQFKYFKEDTATSSHSTIYTRTYFNHSTLSFGMSADEVEKDTAKIVVEFLGSTSDVDRTYTVRIDADSTTAKEGIHYLPFSANQIFRAGRKKDTLEIVVLRSQLSKNFTDPKDIRIALDMEATADFKLGMKDGLRTYLYMNDYLTKPVWWDKPEVSGLNYYHPKKWKKLISFDKKWANKEKEAYNVNSGARAFM